MSKQPKILHIVQNPVIGDSRVLRAAKAIANAFPSYEVECVGYTNDYSEQVDVDNFRISVLKVNEWDRIPKIFSRFLKYLHWHVQCVGKFKTQSVEVIQCHELVPLLISLHLKVRTGCKIIYDAHELETECRTNKFDKLMKPFYKFVERLGIVYSSKVITVSNSIMDWYKNRNPSADVSVIFNCPDTLGFEKPIQKSSKIKRNLTFVYCGGLVPGRGIDLYLDVFSRQPDKKLYFLGDGPLVEKVSQHAKKYKNIVYLGKVKPNEVVEKLKIADVSLCMIEDVTLTSRYCMPNKLFESVVAGLPVIVSDLPDLRKFINEHGTGWVVAYDCKNFYKFIESLDLSSVNKCSSKIIGKSHLFSWSTEKEKLIKIYKDILKY